MSRLYVIADTSLPLGMQAVQAGHCVAQFMLDNPEQTWNNNYLIFLSGDVGKEKNRLRLRERKFSVFQEPDLGWKETALAVETNDRNLFKHLKLLGKS